MNRLSGINGSLITSRSLYSTYRIATLVSQSFVYWALGLHVCDKRLKKYQVQSYANKDRRFYCTSFFTLNNKHYQRIINYLQLTIHLSEPILDV